jgi:hypothetical protein
MEVATGQEGGDGGPKCTFKLQHSCVVLVIILPVNNILLQFSTLFHPSDNTFSVTTSLTITQGNCIAAKKYRIIRTHSKLWEFD